MNKVADDFFFENLKGLTDEQIIATATVSDLFNINRTRMVILSAIGKVKK